MVVRGLRVGLAVTVSSVLVLTGAAGAAAEPTPTPTAGPTTPAPTPTSPAPATTQPTANPAPPKPVTKPKLPTARSVAPAVPATIAGYPRFYRPAIKRGAKDGGVYHILHVRELQYRLTWAKVYTGPITDTFGPMTEAGVKRFQAKAKLRVTGVADVATWQALVSSTVTGLNRVPAVCKQRGWHSCYDRASHQLFAYVDGVLFNSWLVRGGSKTDQTDPGTFNVFARYPSKNSSIYGTLMYYFQKYNGGEGLHGSITMIDPFVGHSHGCVNMYISDSKVLWDLTAGKPHGVTVYGAWH